MTSVLWKTVGRVQSLMGGLSGRSNVAAWAVAGSLAYYLWVKPSQDLKREYEEKAALASLSNSYQYSQQQKSNTEGQTSKSSSEQ